VEVYVIFLAITKERKEKRVTERERRASRAREETGIRRLLKFTESHCLRQFHIQESTMVLINIINL